MPDFIEVHDWCWTCRGTGQKPSGQNGTVDCPACGADGKVFRGFMDVSGIAKKAEVNTRFDIVDARLAIMEEKVAANIPIDAWGYASIIQGTFDRISGPQFYQEKYLGNQDALDGDQVDYRVFMAAGTYMATVIHAKTYLMGIMKMLVDDVEEASIDCYVDSDNTEFIAYTTVYDIVIPTTGIKTISFKADGKNPASGGYYIILSALFFDRTA